MAPRAALGAAPSRRAFELAAARLRSSEPGLTLEAAAGGFRLGFPPAITVEYGPGREGAGRLRIEAALPAEAPGVELRRYSLRSARYIFLWLALHLGAVGPFAFFFADPLGFRRAPGGLLGELLLLLPMAGLAAAMLALLVTILRPRWAHLGAIPGPRGLATGEAWVARGRVAVARALLGDHRVRGVLEARGVERLLASGSTLLIEARGPAAALRIPPGDALLLARGLSAEAQGELDRRFALGLAGQIADLVDIVRGFGAPARAGAPGGPGRALESAGGG